METYPLSFTALKGFQNLPAQGDLIVYESANVALNAEARVRVKPDSGGEVWLKPGQWFRATQLVSNWSIKSFNGNDVIDAFFVIGSGDFGDANTLNKFTLDATFANNVKVTNSVAERVPVTADLTQTIPVSIAGAVTVVGTTVNYTNAFADASTGAQVATPVFLPAANVNGAYIEYAEISASNAGAGNFVASLIAKASAPANAIDGDVVMITSCGGIGTSGSAPTVNDRLGVRIKIAAGKGLYLNQNNGAPSTANKTVLYTLL